MGFLDSEHGDVTAESAGAVGFEFADNNADEGGRCWIEGLDGSVSAVVDTCHDGGLEEVW
jgi:hypothetical protein